jgi:tetratricopeptide (TPR) repeat protein
MAVVQRLVGRVRRELGDRRSDIEADKPLWQAATPSFPAFRKYVDAVELQMRGNLDGSNALLREAVELDSGFATAWATLGLNYVTARNLDSARLAVSEALKRPERMNDAQLYRLRAEAAYALEYDLVGAVHWYDLYLQELPASVGGRNNRGFYLSALGRYEDALADFRRAIELERFGDLHAQPQLLNAAIMLTEMGRLDEARLYYPRLAGNFAAYARLLDAAAVGDWAAAESTGAAVRDDPAVPGWVRMQATGALASARSVRSGPAAAERTLDEAIASAAGPEARWYGQARLLLASASRRGPGPLPPSLRSDTSAGGALLRARWHAGRGDTAAAAALLDTLARASALDQRVLQRGPDLVRGQIALVRGDWREAIRLLGPHAEAGEHDNAALDRPGTLAMRWIVADAWDRMGRPDSAEAALAALVRPVRMPANQIALRGLVVPYAEARLRRFTRTGG